MPSQALVPSLLAQRPNRQSRAASGTDVLIVLTGVALLALLAQVSIPLPFTPVPITGQTLGVLLVSLTLGAKRAVSVLAIYLAVGALGLPVFAMGKAGLVVGPTIGYLVGMFFSSLAVGTLADRGWTRSVPRAYAACFVASVITFGCGLAVLSQFIPRDQLLIAGLVPFLPGDLIKMSIAISLVRPMHRFLKA